MRGKGGKNYKTGKTIRANNTRYKGGKTQANALSSVELTAEEEEYIKNKFGDIELSESEESSESSEGGQEDSDKLNNQHLVNSNKVVSSNKQCKAAIKDPYSPGYENPNHNSLLQSEISLSRSELEKLEKIKARKRYLEAVAAGKTEQSKKDLARLAEVRKRRELASLTRKKADEDTNAEAQHAALNAGVTQEEIITYSALEIKKMKPQKLKEELKKRDLSTQGTKTDLINRLLEACQN